MAIGNGLLDYSLLVNTLIPMLYHHGLVSEKFGNISHCEHQLLPLLSRVWNYLSQNCCNGNPNICSYFGWFTRPSTACFSQVFCCFDCEHSDMWVRIKNIFLWRLGKFTLVHPFIWTCTTCMRLATHRPLFCSMDLVLEELSLELCSDLQE